MKISKISSPPLHTCGPGVLGGGIVLLFPIFFRLRNSRLTVKNAISSAIPVCLYVGLTIINGRKNGQPFFFDGFCDSFIISGEPNDTKQH